jgi:hypothetical protein
MNITIRLAAIMLYCVLTLIPAHANTESPSVDMVLAVDISGSIGKVYRDAYYRAMLVWVADMSAPEDLIGVVTFGDKANIAQTLEPMDRVNFAKLIETFTPPANYTNLLAGLEQAHELIMTSDRQAAARWILLFTDGDIELPAGAKAVKSAEHYLHNILLPAFQREGIKVFVFSPVGRPLDYPTLHMLVSQTDGELFGEWPKEPSRFRVSRLPRENLPKPTPQPQTNQPAFPAEPEAPLVYSGVQLAAVASGLALVVILFAIRRVLRSRQKARELAEILHDLRELRQEGW